MRLPELVVPDHLARAHFLDVNMRIVTLEAPHLELDRDELEGKRAEDLYIRVAVVGPKAGFVAARPMRPQATDLLPIAGFRAGYHVTASLR